MTDTTVKLPELPPRTGWPPPPLAQDDHRKLFRWFASKPDARRLVRTALQGLRGEGN